MTEEKVNPVLCIEYLENYTYKSFVNFTNKNSPFRRVNYIYGNNGAGKSTLARGIEAKGNELRRGTALFNAEYTSENVLIDKSDPNLIAGVVAEFGSENIEISNGIKECDGKISHIKDVISQKEESIKDDIDKILNKISLIFNANKQGANIRRKNKRVENYQNASKWLEDLKKSYENDRKTFEARKGSPETNSVTINCGATEAQKKISYLESLRVPIIPIKFEGFKDVEGILGKEYEVIDEVPNDVIRWIGEGLQIHREGESCKFCMNNGLDLNEISEKFKTFQQQEWIQAQARLNVLIEEFSNSLDAYNSFHTELLELANEYKYNFTLENKLDADLFKKFNDSINKKLEIPTEVAEIKDLGFIERNYNEGYAEVCRLRNSLESRIKGEKKNYEDYINRINDYAKYAVAQEVLFALSEGDLKGSAENINDKINEIKDCEKEMLETVEQKNDLLKSVSRYGKFIEYLNGELASIGMPFRLVEEIIDSGQYVIKNSQGDNVSIKDISEGEKHILSLMYFYYKLFKDENLKKISDDVEIIIIDDPISSLDEGNKLYILNMIMELADQIAGKSGAGKQLFILSHSWEDYNVLTYHRNKDKSGIFEIYKDADESGQISTNIRVMNEKNAMGSYARLFKEVYDIDQAKNLSDLTECQKNHSLNSMRRVFEDYLSFKNRDSLVPHYGNIKHIIEIYELSVGKDIQSGYRKRLSAFLSAINVGSHRITNVDGGDKVKEYARTLMRYIEDTDKVHFNAMKK